MRLLRDYLRTPIASSRAPTGLFGIKGLTSPKDLIRFSRSSLAEAGALAAQLRETRTYDNAAIQKLDKLSDTLCRAVDLAAFLRISHPSHQMAMAAQDVHEQLFGFMSELNTSRELFNLVDQALKNPELNLEERKTAEILKHDFMKSGLGFASDPQRVARFIELSNRISVKGQHFLLGVSEHSPEALKNLSFKASDLEGVSPSLLSQLKVSFTNPLGQKTVGIPLHKLPVAEQIVASASSSAVREKIWRALRMVPKGQVELLDTVLQDRQDLAQLAGYDCYANYELGDKVLRNASNVNAFLTSLAESVAPLAKNELAKLGNVAAPWDYTYALSRYRTRMRRIAAPPTFQVENVFETINSLCGTLYGLRLEPGEISPGEVWSPEVKRLDVYDSKNEKVGVIYCDLVSRPGKQPNPAHFTIQCSRKDFDTGKKQLPIIALVCDFTVGSDGAILLQYHEVQTLFHEMGHAIHSMIGRTDLHNVAGTRCATDFVELPSILFEKFVSEPSVLASMKPGLNAEEFLARQAKVEAATEHWETWHQIWLSFLDQSLHTAEFKGSSAAVARDVTKAHTLFPSVPFAKQQTQQFAQFGHLVSYGATYYSYLFDRCLASMTWETLFKDPENWEAGGERFSSAVLRWGGARNPQECIEELLGHELDPRELASSLIHPRRRSSNSRTVVKSSASTATPTSRSNSN